MRNFQRNIFLLVWLLVMGGYLTPQNYLLQQQHFSIEEGLSHRNVQCVHQDRRGLLWLGTHYGLNRFDGYQFRWFTKEKNGLSSNEINHILEDSQGRMWLIDTELYGIKNVNSISLFDPETEQALPLEKAIGEEESAALKTVVGFAGDDQGRLVFLTADSRLVFFDPSFRVVDIDLEPYQNIVKVYQAPTGLVWIVFQATSAAPAMKIWAFDRQGRRVHKIEPEEPATFVYLYDLDKEGQGRFILSKYGQYHQFYQFNAEGVLKIDSLSAQTIGQLNLNFDYFSRISHLQCNQGTYWIHLSDHFVVFDPRTGWQEILTEKNKDFGYTTGIFFNQAQGAWVSTQFGLYNLKFQPNWFSRIIFGKKNALNPVRALEMDGEGQLWIVRDNKFGLWRATFPEGVRHPPVIRSINEEKDESARIPFGSIFFDLVKTRNGDLCWALPSHAIRFDPQTGTHCRIDLLEPGKGKGRIWSLYEDEEGRVWFATDEGWLGYFQDGPATLVTRLDSTRSLLHVYQFLPTRDGSVWLASEAGLFTLNTAAEKITGRYWSGGEGDFHLPFDVIHHMLVEDDGSFWLATGGTGLVRWSPETGRYEQFTQADGLSNNTIYAVYDDQLGNLWLPSDYGIIRFNKETHQTETYLEEDGITHNEFNRLSHYQHTDGTLFFGGLNGVTAFNPRDLLLDSTENAPPLIITGAQQFKGRENRLLDITREVHETNTITLSPDDPFFRLDFALLTFEDVEKVQYAHLVEGIYQSWSYHQENYLRLGRLPYGEHLLRIKGQNSRGQWSQEELTVVIRVLRPFYLKTWFLVLVVYSIFLGTYGVYLWRIRSYAARQAELEQLVAARTQKISEDKKVIERQAEELQSLDRLKSRFFANVSHELRTPLTLMLGPVNTLLESDRYTGPDRRLLEFIRRNARQLHKLINEILDLSRLEEDKLAVFEEPVHLHPFLEDQLAQFRTYGPGDQLIFDFAYQADTSLHVLLDKDKVEKILQNLLSNAMKYTPAGGRITLLVEEEEAYLRLSVQDTGRGIHPDDLPFIFDRFYQSRKNDLQAGGTGIGLSLCKELVQLMEGEIWAESDPQAGGSTFYFRLPKQAAAPASPSTLEDPAEVEVPASPAPASQEEEPVLVLPAEDRRVTGKETPTPGTPPATVLIAEDNPDLQAYLELLLSAYRVVTVGDGASAWDYLQGGGKCNLVISDVMMPVMDGLQLLENLKSDDRFRHLPVIMLTAKVNISTKLTALRIGVDDYLTKPFQEDELKVRVENLLRNYRERMAFFANRSSKKDGSTPPVMAQVDAEWLQEVEALFAKHLSDSQFKMNRVSAELNLSQRQINRRLQQLTGLTPNQYLQEMRLQHARDYLLEGKFATVKEVSFSVGFRDAKYFSRLFRERFGQLPSEFR